MKKLLFVLAVAAFATACNDSSNADAPQADTTAPIQAAPDSTTAAPDSSALKVDSAAPAAVDTPSAAH